MFTKKMNIENRWQAFGVHLALSLVIFLFILSIILFVWYPGPFIHMGGFQGIKIVAGVDLVLGPVLTLMIFNPNKRAILIKLDLSIIAFVQFSALLAGCYLVYNERPLVQVLSDDGIYVHSLSEFKNDEIDRSILSSFSTTYPKIVFLDLPEDQSGKTVLKNSTLLVEGHTITLSSDLYKDINKVDQNILASRLDKFPYSEEKKCHTITVESYHHIGLACFDVDNGVMSLISPAGKNSE